MQEKNKKKNLKNSYFYSEFSQKKIHPMQLISLQHKQSHWMYYNWLNFPVNLQLTAYSVVTIIDYNWLNFPVNLQQICLAIQLVIYYNWLNFPVNLQLTVYPQL